MALAVLVSLLGLGLAFPFTALSREGYPGSPPDNSTPYTATFEDLCPVVGAAAVQNVGPYDGLDYQDMFLVSLGLEGINPPGLDPASGTNVAAYGPRTEDPLITTQYAGSSTNTFDLHKFFFGCAIATQETLASIPIPCKIRARGYKASKEIGGADQTFDFDPDYLDVLGNLLVADLTEAKLNEYFKGVDTVRFSTDYDLPTNAIGATVLDDLNYIVNYASPPEPAQNEGKGKPLTRREQCWERT